MGGFGSCQVAKEKEGPKSQYRLTLLRRQHDKKSFHPFSNHINYQQALPG